MRKKTTPQWKPTVSKVFSTLFASFFIPLSPSSQWTSFEFNKIPPNKVQHSKDHLDIHVKHSASPLIYSLKQSKKAHGVKIKARLNSPLPKLKANSTQGDKGNDDFILRAGLILKGNDRMSWMQRQLAPNWLVEMEKKLPKGQGVEKVYFLTTCRDKSLLNKKRSHFLNSRFQEECILHLDKNGDFELSKKFTKPYEILGIWLASDGDDLKSEFQLRINEIILE